MASLTWPVSGPRGVAPSGQGWHYTLWKKRRHAVDILTRRVDRNGKVTLPVDFAGCLVTIERHRDELRVCKPKRVGAPRYSFKQLMAGVTRKNIHGEVPIGSRQETTSVERA
jgi:hypothetical protein